MSAWAGKVVAVCSISRRQLRQEARFPPARHPGVFCAEDFVAQGASLFLVDPDPTALAGLAAALEAKGGAIETFQAELADPAALEAAAAACRACFGRIDVLVCAHMEIAAGAVEEAGYETWRFVVEQDLLGPVFAAKAFLPLLKDGQDPAVVHLGSVDGLLGHQQFASYSAAKAGLAGLTRVMAHDFGRYGIRVNCVARALISEADQARQPSALGIEAQTALKRWGAAEEIAAAVRFLASPQASYITGAVLPVDGGIAALTPGCAG